MRGAYGGTCAPLRQVLRQGPCRGLRRCLMGGSGSPKCAAICWCCWKGQGLTARTSGAVSHGFPFASAPSPTSAGRRASLLSPVFDSSWCGHSDRRSLGSRISLRPSVRARWDQVIVPFATAICLAPGLFQLKGLVSDGPVNLRWFLMRVLGVVYTSFVGAGG